VLPSKRHRPWSSAGISDHQPRLQYGGGPRPETGAGHALVAISIAEIPCMARKVRSSVLVIREQPYVEAAVTNGTKLSPAKCNKDSRTSNPLLRKWRARRDSNS
jgi:hypothetical protein